MPFTFQATMQDTRDGTVRTVDCEWPFDLDDEATEILRFQWLDNNWSCDCNRSREFFGRDGDESKIMPCGDKLKLLKLAIGDRVLFPDDHDKRYGILEG